MSRAYHKRQDNYFKHRLYITSDMYVNMIKTGEFVKHTPKKYRYNYNYSNYKLSKSFIEELNSTFGALEWRMSRKGDDKLRLEFKNLEDYVATIVRLA